MDNNWKYKSLQNLQKKKWSESAFGSHLTKRCFLLSKTPLVDFNIEDLRLMVSQNIGLEYLIPLAIEKLQKNILAEGDYYPGDLLKSVISIDADFWVKNAAHYSQLKQIIESNKTELASTNIGLENF